MERDEWLRLDDTALAQQCALVFFVGSGKGGQKRNKSSSAVRVTHRESGCSAEDCTERSQHRNRSNALKKLRRTIALRFRNPPAPPLRTECALESPDYPLWLATLLDYLAAAEYDHKVAARLFGLTPSALIKKLYRDPEAWSFVQKERLERSRPPLLPPGGK